MKIINSKEEKKKMSSECPNCGYKMSNKDKTCKYCGTKNENYSGTASFMTSLMDTQNKQEGAPQQMNSRSGYIAIGILFLFIFWPMSIFFFVMASKMNKDS